MTIFCRKIVTGSTRSSILIRKARDARLRLKRVQYRPPFLKRAEKALFCMFTLFATKKNKTQNFKKQTKAFNHLGFQRFESLNLFCHAELVSASYKLGIHLIAGKTLK